MAKEDTEETIMIDIDADAGGGRRGDWPDWEQERRRSFLSAAERNLDSAGRLGRVRNLALEMIVRRDGTGFSGSWNASIDEAIGPLRLDRPDVVALRLLDQQGNIVVETTATDFAHRCGGWVTRSYSGSLTREQFDRIATLGIATRGNVGARRC
jgi:hypothetical protein